MAKSHNRRAKELAAAIRVHEVARKQEAEEEAREARKTRTAATTIPCHGVHGERFQRETVNLHIRDKGPDWGNCPYLYPGNYCRNTVAEKAVSCIYTTD